MRWSTRIVTALLIIIALIGSAQVARAALTYDQRQPWRYIPHLLNADVTITATPNWTGCGPPISLTLIYVSINEIQVDWTKGNNADKTMVRASYGHVPEDRDDGYLVYYDTGETVSDNSFDWDTNLGKIYFRAWSQNADGEWETTGASGEMEGTPVTLLTTIIIILAIVALAYWRQDMILYLIAGLAVAIWGLNYIRTSVWLGSVGTAFGFYTAVRGILARK